MVYLFSRCYGGLFHRHMIIFKLFYLLYTSFMLTDQSTDSVILKSKLQQQILFQYSAGPFLGIMRKGCTLVVKKI